MGELLRVGIAGFGGAGLAQMGHFNAIRGCRVVAVFDPNDDGLERARRRDPSLRLTRDFEAFLASGIDAVAVCSPDKVHCEHLVGSLRSGKHAVCEKPLCDSVEACREILRAEKEAVGCVAAVQHQMRALPLHRRIKEIVSADGLGSISYIEGYYVHDLRERAFANDKWRLTDNATPLVYSGCHFVDLLRWLLGDEVEEVMAMANHRGFPAYPESDLNAVLLRFRSGVIGKVIVAFGAGRPQDHSIRIYGEKACIENNLLFTRSGKFKVIARPQFASDPWLAKNPLRTLANLGRNLSAPAVGFMMEGLMRFQAGRHPYYAINAYPLRLYEHSAAVRSSLENFVASIRSGEPVQCTLTDAAKTVATCVAGVESFRTHETVRIRDYWPKEMA